MSLLLLELPGFHNLALLQGDLGMSRRSHGYRSGNIHWSGLPAGRKNNIVALGRVLAQTGCVESWPWNFEPWNNRQVSSHVLILHLVSCKVIIVIPTLAGNCRKITVGARCLAPNRCALSSLTHSLMEDVNEDKAQPGEGGSTAHEQGWFLWYRLVTMSGCGYICMLSYWDLNSVLKTLVPTEYVE